MFCEGVGRLRGDPGFSAGPQENRASNIDADNSALRVKKPVRPTLGGSYRLAEKVAWGNNLRSYSFKFTV